MAFHLKLNQPKELPAEGLTSAQFKPWQNHLTNFLQQDVNNYRFLPGGDYQVWKAANEVESNLRIEELHVNDEDLQAINASAEAATKAARKVKLLRERNSQLAKMIQHIVSFVHYTEADDIDQLSTGVAWILTYLQQHYNIQTKGANFLKITDHVYKTEMSPQVFYKQFRSSFLNNLRKTGEKMTHKGGKALTEDENLSPSFEDAIVLWALEKIDPRLPKKVRKDYEHRLTGDIYLIDLQITIFQSIPSMLEDLNKQADLNAIAASKLTYQEDGGDDTALNAFRPFNTRGKSSYRGGRGGTGNRSGTARYIQKECRVCRAAGKPAQVYNSHSVGTCGFFNKQDRQDMYTSLKAMDLSSQNDDEESWTAEDEGEVEED